MFNLNNTNLNVKLQIFIHVVDVIEDILYNSRNNPLVDWIIKMTLKEWGMKIIYQKSLQGLQKVQSGRPVNFQASNFSFSLVQWSRAQAIPWPTNTKKVNLRLAQDKQNLRTASLLAKLAITLFFSSPG